MMSDSFDSLMSDFDFTEADLQANRERHLTERQIDILKQKRRRKLIVLIIVAATFVFVLIVFQAIYPTNPNKYFLFALVPLFVVALIYMLLVDYERLRSDITSGVVDNIYGQPSFRTLWGRRAPTYEVTIGEKMFNVTRAQYQALEAYFQKESSGLILTVYFTPSAKHILSMERKD